MKMNFRVWVFFKEMVFVCGIWSVGGMGLGEQGIFFGKKIEGISML